MRASVCMHTGKSLPPDNSVPRFKLDLPGTSSCTFFFQYLCLVSVSSCTSATNGPCAASKYSLLIQWFQHFKIPFRMASKASKLIKRNAYAAQWSSMMRNLIYIHTAALDSLSHMRTSIVSYTVSYRDRPPDTRMPRAESLSCHVWT